MGGGAACKWRENRTGVVADETRSARNRDPGKRWGVAFDVRLPHVCSRASCVPLPFSQHSTGIFLPCSPLLTLVLNFLRFPLPTFAKCDSSIPEWMLRTQKWVKISPLGNLETHVLTSLPPGRVSSRTFQQRPGTTVLLITMIVTRLPFSSYRSSSPASLRL